MPDQPKFRLCITMAGAVSAGSYTGGVVDYLLETLELWEKAKEKNRSLGEGHPDYDKSIPMHDVEIDVISGASAGGITGTLTMLSLLDKNHRPYNENNPNGVNNKFYESWVTMADNGRGDTLEKMLRNDDLKDKVPSLLNTDAIEEIADKALKVVSSQDSITFPSYVSQELDLVLTTTNLRGVNFKVDFSGANKNDDNGTVITTHGGFFRYKIANGDLKSGIPDGGDELFYVIDPKDEKDIGALRDATLSTAAFPIGLKSREITISNEYIKRFPRYLFGDREGITAQEIEGDTYTFNSIDGGLINNEPYGIGLKILRERMDKQDFDNGKYAVIMVDPFPNKDTDTSKSESNGILDIAAGMFKSLRNQVMFNQDGILDALDLKNRTKFLIEPVRKVERNGSFKLAKNVLASAPISGFAGFLSADLRKHDYQLGRYNCQAFLRYHFSVALGAVKDRLGVGITDEASSRFRFSDKPKDETGNMHFPIIPDMRVLKNFDEQLDTDTYGADAKISLLPFPSVNFEHFEKKYKKSIKKRLQKVSNGLIDNTFFKIANWLFLRGKMYKAVIGMIKKELKEGELLK
ncbi:patatin-like phospholipase family protein [Spongiivirga sp. MCCC 1A20706]|uniref:patatin-like phospholipase family protein n=1 Tax=Spongiivirga sp. MCCC 1A20706 TaxID=3160963 RepID=UPI0039775136